MSSLIKFQYPLWQCISREALAKLILVQWKLYGTKLKCLEKDPEYNIESLEEIDRLMRQRPKSRRAAG